MRMMVFFLSRIVAGRRMTGRRSGWIGIIFSIVANAACTTPGEHLMVAAEAQDLSGIQFRAQDHLLSGYYDPGRPPSSDTLHVYLGGDGTPWIRGRRPARDPTPRNPLILELLRVDPAPRLLLNRPCYGHATTPSSPCRPALWTGARYSAEVVDALDTALDQARRTLDKRRIVLVGYSGGGTLAWLLARRRDDVAALVTVAANLDHDSWTALHGYLPLEQSLRPLALPPLPGDVTVQWHFVGGRDRRVPEHVTRAVADRDANGRVRRYEEFGHVCCWAEAWPDILMELETELARHETGRPAAR